MSLAILKNDPEYRATSSTLFIKSTDFISQSCDSFLKNKKIEQISSEEKTQFIGFLQKTRQNEKSQYLKNILRISILTTGVLLLVAAIFASPLPILFSASKMVGVPLMLLSFYVSLRVFRSLGNHIKDFYLSNVVFHVHNMKGLECLIKKLSFTDNSKINMPDYQKELVLSLLSESNNFFPTPTKIFKLLRLKKELLDSIRKHHNFAQLLCFTSLNNQTKPLLESILASSMKREIIFRELNEFFLHH